MAKNSFENRREMRLDENDIFDASLDPYDQYQDFDYDDGIKRNESSEDELEGLDKTWDEDVTDHGSSSSFLEVHPEDDDILYED